MAQLGVVAVWIWLGDAAALVGFGSGVSLVSIFTKLGGGVCASGLYHRGLFTGIISTELTACAHGAPHDTFRLTAFRPLCLWPCIIPRS